MSNTSFTFALTLVALVLPACAVTTEEGPSSGTSSAVKGGRDGADPGSDGTKSDSTGSAGGGSSTDPGAASGSSGSGSSTDPSDPRVPPKADCGPMKAVGYGDCRAILGFSFDGTRCNAVVGCKCDGPSCAALLSEKACGELAAACTPPKEDDCAVRGKALRGLLASLQVCSPGSMRKEPECDGTALPSVDGCDAPIAREFKGEAAKKYLEQFRAYAEACPLPDRPCLTPDPTTASCAPSTDGTGRCAYKSTPKADGSAF